MIVFKTKQQAIDLRQRALDALQNSDFINKQFEENFNTETLRKAKFLDRAEDIIKEANDFLNDLGKKEMDKILNI